MLMFITVGLPLIVMLPIATFVARNAWDVHNCICGLFMSFTMTGVITQAIKLMVGRPRPDLIARCQPPAGAHDAAVYGLSTWKICTQKNFYILNDGFKSFPSGHSSRAYLLCPCLRRRGHPPASCLPTLVLNFLVPSLRGTAHLPQASPAHGLASASTALALSWSPSPLLYSSSLPSLPTYTR